MTSILENFPLVPSEKNGWPWVPEKEIQRNDCTESWPRITIITPSYNQGQFLEETIRSVLLQGYPSLEYIVIDGGSTDNSIEIIRTYEPWISYWVSEPDRGQAHAINKALECCTGDLVGWINSDDLLLPGSLHALGEAHQQNPNAVLFGDVYSFIDGTAEKVRVRQKNISFKAMAHPASFKAVWHQPGVYVPAGLVKENHIYLDESLRYVFDQDWLCRLLQQAEVCYMPDPIAMFRVHASSKTIKERALWLPEYEEVFSRYWQQAAGENPDWLLARFELYRAAVRFGGMTWEPEVARQHLRRAVQISPAVMFSFRFLELSLRSIIPYDLMMKLRSLYGRLNPMFRARQ